VKEVLWGRIGVVGNVTGRGTIALVFEFESDKPIRVRDTVRVKRPDGSSIQAVISAVEDARTIRDGVAVPNIGLVFQKLKPTDLPERSHIYLLEKDENA